MPRVQGRNHTIRIHFKHTDHTNDVKQRPLSPPPPPSAEFLCAARLHSFLGHRLQPRPAADPKSPPCEPATLSCCRRLPARTRAPQAAGPRRGLPYLHDGAVFVLQILRRELEADTADAACRVEPLMQAAARLGRGHRERPPSGGHAAAAPAGVQDGPAGSYKQKI